MPIDHAFLADLRSALLHANDPAYLESHPLTERLTAIRQRSDVSPGQALRQVLRLAIESLDPGAGVPANAPEARAYQALRYHYIGRQSMLEVAARLNLGERQAYRELQRGVAALARILTDADASAAAEPKTFGDATPTRADKVREEIERLSAGRSQEIDVVALVHNAVESVRGLAASRGVTVCVRTPASPLPVTAQRVMLRQAFVNILSHLIRHERGEGIEVAVEHTGQQALVRLVYHSQTTPESTSPGTPYAVAAELLNSLGVQWQAQALPTGAVALSVRIPLARKRAVLIVDDNEGLIALFRRYLSHEPYTVHGATNVEQALAMLPEVRPDVLILDVMMPEHDGWEALQILRSRCPDEGHPHSPRIIVCSIINDPELSVSLGADAFLHKPVDRAALVRTLASVMREQ